MLSKDQRLHPALTKNFERLDTDGSGTLTDSGQSALGASATSAMEFADFDGDGDLDVFAANIGGTGSYDMTRPD